MRDDIKITTEIHTDRQTASSGSKWEPLMGYSRGEQTRRSLLIIRKAIESLGGKIEQVIRTRMYVTDVSKWEQVAKVHGEVFAQIRPATTIVQVAQLIDKEAQIEIEADAVVPESAGS